MRKTLNVLVKKRGMRNIYIVSLHWGKAYIICIFHEIINIILFYISLDRRFNSLSCAMRKIAISRKKKNDSCLSINISEEKNKPSRNYCFLYKIVKRRDTHSFFLYSFFILNTWNYFHHRDR